MNEEFDTEYMERVQRFAKTDRWRTDMDKIIGRVPFGKGLHLDVGCGTGEFCHSLAYSDQDKIIYGLDVNKVAIKVARSNAVDSHRERFIHYDGAERPFPNNWFESISCSYTLTHVKSIDLLIYDMAQMLKFDGKLFLVVKNNWFTRWMWLPNQFNGYIPDPTHKHWLTRRQLVRLLKKHGLKVTHAEYTGSNAKGSPFEFTRQYNLIVAKHVDA